MGAVRDLEREFPGWSAWHSDAGRWWAFRTSASPLTIEELRAGRRLIVQADTVDELWAAVRTELELPGEQPVGVRTAEAVDERGERLVGEPGRHHDGPGGEVGRGPPGDP